MLAWAILLIAILIFAYVVENKSWQNIKSFANLETKIIMTLQYWQGLVIITWRDLVKLGIKLPILKIIYIGVALFIFYYLIEIFFNLRKQLFTDIDNLEDGQLRNLAIAFLGTISGIGALFGVYLAILRSEETKRQNDTAEQGLITDRISRATEGLGKINGNDEPILEVRVGALYALERIAQDSPRDHVRIMKILCAYVRLNNPLQENLKVVGKDTQVALRIIGWRERWLGGKKNLDSEDEQRYKIDLSNCNLQGGMFNASNLQDAQFHGANLNYAQFLGANLKFVTLTGTTLTGANLTWAITTGACARNGDFLGCETLTQEHLDEMFCGIDVKIPNHLKRPQHWPKNHLSAHDFLIKSGLWQNSKLIALNKKGKK